MDTAEQTTAARAGSAHGTELARRIATREAVVAVVGLGYVGLPLAVAYAEAGFPVVGLDVDPARIDDVNAGRSRIQDVPSPALAAVAGRLRATADPAALRTADVVVICVPTPMTKNKEPDVSHIRDASEAVAAHWRPGQLVVLRSTSYPGTTEEIVCRALRAHGAIVGETAFVAFAPERIDPGRTDPPPRRIPAVVGGCDPESTRLAALALQPVAERVVVVSSPIAAEMTKLLENVFRNVNIALVNQLAMLCERMGLDIWEIVDAAATKPYGFMRFTPGPGVGGHCIPVDPYYLSWKAREFDFHMDFIELAARVNDAMPYWVVNKLMAHLPGPPDPARPVFLIGVAFKKDVADARHAPALRIMELLSGRRVPFVYHDPLIPEVEAAGRRLRSVDLTPEALAASACALIVVDHASLDLRRVVEHAPLVFDTRNATRGIPAPAGRIIRL